MAKDKVYDSIIDSFLSDENSVKWEDVGLKEALTSGEQLLDRTHNEADDFLDSLVTGKAAKRASTPLEARMAEMADAAPRLGGNRPANTRFASVEDGRDPSDSTILDDITMSFETAEKGATVEKKSESDAELIRWIKNMLNNGNPPHKIAAEMDKMAEMDLGINRTLGQSYLDGQAEAGFGLATVDSNHRGSCENTYNHVMASKGEIRAKSVKQIKACAGCSYFKNNSGQKVCSLYKRPVVANAQELGAIVNKLTAGVPKGSKKAALVQIANGTTEHIENKVIGRPENKKAAEGQEKRASNRDKVTEKPSQYFDGAMITKLHVAGHSLKKIAKAATTKFGSLETSKGIREFVSTLKATKGQIVLAKEDAKFLKVIGIHNAAIVGAEKCMSCAAHVAHPGHKTASKPDGVTRTKDTFTERTMDTVRASKTKKTVHVDASTIEKLHNAGHSLEKIYKAASTKVGTLVASKAVKEFVAGLKNTNTKIALSQIDCTFLKNKLGTQNVIIGANKCGSCTYRNGMHCGLTGGTLLTFPNMDKQATNIKIASDAPKDGYAMLSEYDLMGAADQQDITMNTDREDIL
jgi:hypothetical protein